MDYEIEEEFKEFIADINTNELSHELYLREDDYEDEYSHNQIGEAKNELVKKIRHYLEEHHPGQYCVFIDWCVRVMDVDLAKKKNITNYMRYLVDKLNRKIE